MLIVLLLHILESLKSVWPVPTIAVTDEMNLLSLLAHLTRFLSPVCAHSDTEHSFVRAQILKDVNEKPRLAIERGKGDLCFTEEDIQGGSLPSHLRDLCSTISQCHAAHFLKQSLSLVEEDSEQGQRDRATRNLSLSRAEPLNLPS